MDENQKPEQKKNHKWILILVCALIVVVVVATIFQLRPVAKSPEQSSTQSVEQPKEIVQQQPAQTSSKNCGNGICATDETYATCAVDCPVKTCGDGVVQSDENWQNCKYDILAKCDDGICQSWEASEPKLAPNGGLGYEYNYCSLDCHV